MQDTSQSEINMKPGDEFGQFRLSTYKSYVEKFNYKRKRTDSPVGEPEKKLRATDLCGVTSSGIQSSKEQVHITTYSKEYIDLESGSDDDVVFEKSLPLRGSREDYPLLLDCEESTANTKFDCGGGRRESQSKYGSNTSGANNLIDLKYELSCSKPSNKWRRWIDPKTTSRERRSSSSRAELLQSFTDIYGEFFSDKETRSIVDLASPEPASPSSSTIFSNKPLTREESPLENFNTSDLSLQRPLPAQSLQSSIENPVPGTVRPVLRRTSTRKTIEERKKFYFIEPSTNHPDIQRAFDVQLEKLWAKVGWHRPTDANFNVCWFYPPSPSSHSSIRTWLGVRDHEGVQQCITPHVGVIPLFMQKRLTPEMIDGYVYKSWHLSHLCGNWTCCNPAHHTIESGKINQSRKKCHKLRLEAQCPHEPSCLVQFTLDMPQPSRGKKTTAVDDYLARTLSSQDSGPASNDSIDYKKISEKIYPTAGWRQFSNII